MTQATRPAPKPGILDIEAYVPGKSGAKGAKVFKLSSNESPIGASPKAVEACHASAERWRFIRMAVPRHCARPLPRAMA